MQDREQLWAADMRAAQAGSGEAYIRLLDSVSTSFRQFAALDLRRFGLQAADVEDGLKDILLAIPLKGHTWGTDHPFAPWLRAIIRHKLVDFVRRRRRRGELPLDDFPDIRPVAPVEPSFSTPLRHLLGDLPRRPREVVEELGLGAPSLAATPTTLHISRHPLSLPFHPSLPPLR